MSSEEIERKNRKQGKKGAKKNRKSTTDLAISRHSKNPYPVFQMFLKSERFTKEELVDALEILSRADLRLKTAGQSPKLVLEEVIFQICRS